jgi:hypothetical protein
VRSVEGRATQKRQAWKSALGGGYPPPWGGAVTFCKPTAAVTPAHEAYAVGVAFVLQRRNLTFPRSPVLRMSHNLVGLHHLHRHREVVRSMACFDWIKTLSLTLN